MLIDPQLHGNWVHHVGSTTSLREQNNQEGKLDDLTGCVRFASCVERANDDRSDEN